MVETSTEFDTVLDLCRDQHRRIVTAVLAHERRPVTVNDLTKTIVKHNHHASVRAVPTEELTAIRVSLFHTHVPNLEDRSLVDYDQDRTLVTPTSQFDRLEPQLSAIIDADPGLEAPVSL